MRSVDVNVLIYAFDESSPRHDRARALLLDLAAGPDPLLLFPTVTTGFLRVTTDPRILGQPAEPDQALAFISALLDIPAVHPAAVEADAWNVFRSLVEQHGLRGADMTDGLLAACAITAGVEWYSYDRGFTRFRDLAWVHPDDLD
jgi:toxin-antitoxin system PIN domain toxin